MRRVPSNYGKSPSPIGYAQRARSKSPKIKKSSDEPKSLNRSFTSSSTLRGKRLIDKQEVFVNMTGIFDKYLRVYSHEKVLSPLKDPPRKKQQLVDQDIAPQIGQGGELMRAQSSHRNMVSFSDNEFTVESSLQSREGSAEQLHAKYGKGANVSAFQPNWSGNQSDDPAFQLMLQSTKDEMPVGYSPTKIPRINNPGSTAPPTDPMGSQLYLLTKHSSSQAGEKLLSDSMDLRLSEENLEKLAGAGGAGAGGGERLLDTDSMSSRVMSESELMSIAKLLSAARGKNANLKKTIAVLKKHSTLQENEVKLVKQKLIGAELQNKKLHEQLSMKDHQVSFLQENLLQSQESMKQRLESVQEQNGHQSSQKTAKIDALLAQLQAKNKRLKDYKRDNQRLKEELEHQKASNQRLKNQLDMSERLRNGMSGIIEEAHRDLKVFCKAQEDQNIQFSELVMGVNPNELHVLSIENEEEKHTCYFDHLFTDLSSPKDMFPHLKGFLKSMVKGDQASFIFMNGALDQTARGSLLALTFQYLQSQIENFSNLGSPMQLLFRLCPRATGPMLKSLGIRRTSQQRPRKISDLLRDDISPDSEDPGPDPSIDQLLLKFDDSWSSVSKFAEVGLKVASAMEEGQLEEDYLIYQFRIKSDTDDYLGIFRILSVFELRGSLLLGKGEGGGLLDTEQSIGSMGKLPHAASLLSFDKGLELQENSAVVSKPLSGMPQKLLKVVGEVVNKNEHAADLEEGLSEGKNMLFLHLGEGGSESALELASMTGTLMES